MRIYLQTTPNTDLLFFDYQQKMLGVIHKWLGSNEIHDKISLYSYSWLANGRMVEKRGFTFPKGATFFISFYEGAYLQKLIQAILADPDMFCGLKVTDVSVVEPPMFMEEPQYFRLASPIFIKRASPGGSDYKYYLFDNPESSALMTETLKHKMEVAGLPPDDTLKVEFDLSYEGKRKKMITIHGIKSIASMCPVIIHGKPESKAFAWIVGVGNSTGASFGALF